MQRISWMLRHTESLIATALILLAAAPGLSKVPGKIAGSRIEKPAMAERLIQDLDGRSNDVAPSETDPLPKVQAFRPQSKSSFEIHGDKGFDLNGLSV